MSVGPPVNDSQMDLHNKPYSPIVVDLATVQEQFVQYLWNDRIPLGKLTLITGDPGLGKSLVTVWLSKQVTTGCPFPDEINGTTNEPGSVLLLAAEDDIQDTIKPRLHAAGADCSRVHPLKAVKGQTGEEWFDLTKHLSVIEELVTSIGDCRLMSIDPISSYLGKVDQNSETEVRNALNPLAELAADKKFSVVFTLHPNKSTGKGAIHRVKGSGAFVAISRAVWLVNKDKDDEGRRLFLPIKMNLSKDVGGLAFRTIPSAYSPKIPVLEWEDGEIHKTADECVADASTEMDTKARKDERSFLASILSNGPELMKTIQERSGICGFAWRTMVRASDDLCVEKKKLPGADGKWMWSLAGVVPAPPSPP